MPMVPRPPKAIRSKSNVCATFSVELSKKYRFRPTSPKWATPWGRRPAIEAVLGIEAMCQGLVLPTVNHRDDPEFTDIDVVPNQTRRHPHEFFLSTAFGFGGTNCCIVFRGV